MFLGLRGTVANEKQRKVNGGGERTTPPDWPSIPALIPHRRESSRALEVCVSGMALRWGIVSVGLISSDFTTVLRTLPPSEHQVRPPSGILGKSRRGAGTPGSEGRGS